VLALDLEGALFRADQVLLYR